MSVAIKVFYPELKDALGGSDQVRVEGATVGECLADLVGRWPQARSLLFDAGGGLLKQVYVFVNQEGMYKADFARAVRDNDVLILAVLATGG
jgi:molybdopterin converting factor small subunit